MHMHMHMHMRMCGHIADVVLQVHARRVEQLFHRSSSSATEVYPYLTPHLGAPPPAAVP